MGCGTSSPKEEAVAKNTPRRNSPSPGRGDLGSPESVLPSSRPSTKQTDPFSSTMGSLSTGNRTQPSTRLAMHRDESAGRSVSPPQSAAAGPALRSTSMGRLAVRRDVDGALVQVQSVSSGTYEPKLPLSPPKTPPPTSQSPTLPATKPPNNSNKGAVNPLTAAARTATPPKLTAAKSAPFVKEDYEAGDSSDESFDLDGESSPSSDPRGDLSPGSDHKAPKGRPAPAPVAPSATAVTSTAAAAAQPEEASDPSRPQTGVSHILPPAPTPAVAAEDTHADAEPLGASAGASMLSPHAATSSSNGASVKQLSSTACDLQTPDHAMLSTTVAVKPPLSRRETAIPAPPPPPPALAASALVEQSSSSASWGASSLAKMTGARASVSDVFTPDAPAAKKAARPRSGQVRINGAAVGAMAQLTPHSKSLLLASGKGAGAPWAMLDDGEPQPPSGSVSPSARKAEDAAPALAAAAGEGSAQQSMEGFAFGSKRESWDPGARTSVDSGYFGNDKRTSTSSERCSSQLSFAMTNGGLGRNSIEEQLLGDMLRSVDKTKPQPVTLDSRVPLHFFHPLLTRQAAREGAGKRIAGRPNGAMLVLPDVGPRATALGAVLVALEAYAMATHRRMLCDLFAYVVASGSSGHFALALSQGDDVKAALQRLWDHAGILLRPKPPVTTPAAPAFHTDISFTEEMTLNLCYDAASIPDADTDRRMCHGYRRGPARVAWPCFVATDEFGTALRIVDWHSQLPVLDVARMACNTFSSVQHGDSRYGPAETCPDPILLATIVDPLPSLVIRLTFEKDDPAEDDAISGILTALLGEGFIDIMLPPLSAELGSSSRCPSGAPSPVATPPGSAQASRQASPSKSDMGASVQGQSQWLAESDKMERLLQRLFIDAGEAFVEDNEDVLGQVVDLLASRAADMDAAILDAGLIPDEIDRRLGEI